MLNVYVKKRRGVANASCSDSPVTKPDALDLLHPLLLLNLVHLFLINKKHRQILVVVEKYTERQRTESNANVILCLEHLHQQHPLLIQQSHPPLSQSQKPDL